MGNIICSKYFATIFRRSVPLTSWALFICLQCQCHNPALSVGRLFCQLYAAQGPHKGTQTETSLLATSCNANGTSLVQADGVLPQCSCDAKAVFNDLKDQLQREHDAEKDSALKSLEERV